VWAAAHYRSLDRTNARPLPQALGGFGNITAMREETIDTIKYWYKILVLFAGIGAVIALIAFGASVLTVGALMILAFLWIVGPNQGRDVAWATPGAAKTKLSFRPFFIAIFVVCGFFLGFTQPLEISGITESLHRPVTGLLYSAGGGIFGRIICWLRPITSP